MAEQQQQLDGGPPMLLPPQAGPGVLVLAQQGTPDTRCLQVLDPVITVSTWSAGQVRPHTRIRTAVCDRKCHACACRRRSCTPNSGWAAMDRRSSR